LIQITNFSDEAGAISSFQAVAAAMATVGVGNIAGVATALALGLTAVWQVADTLNGLMAAPNLIALIALGGVVAKERTKLLTQRADGAPRPKV
jgi:Na+/alanine symporter